MSHLIIGGNHPTAVGQSLRYAAAELGLHHDYLDYDEINRSHRIIRAFYWRFCGKRPPKLGSLNKAVLAKCTKNETAWLHCVGNLAVTAETLLSLRRKGVHTSIWLTDDPWNRAHYSPRLMRALPHYDVIFTPRRANMADLTALGCPIVSHLPFGYDHRYFHPVPNAKTIGPDLFFAGGADNQRVSFMTPLIKSGLDVGLYGAYWDRYPSTRAATKGYASPSDLAPLIAGSRLCLCLVRRANRDGHCMRTFELAAVGACILADDTAEHRAIFGEDGAAVAYITNSADAERQCRKLLNAPADRLRMSERAYQLISAGGHTYAHRLSSILNICHPSAPQR